MLYSEQVVERVVPEPRSFPEFNTGVLAYRRSPQMDSVLKNWSALYRAFLEEHPGQEINDQPFFRAAVYSSSARIATLTREYNCKFRGQGYLNGPVKILHGHVDRQLDQGFVRTALAVLNGSSRPRVYIAGAVYEQKLVGQFLTAEKLASSAASRCFPNRSSWPALNACGKC